MRINMPYWLFYSTGPWWYGRSPLTHILSGEAIGKREQITWGWWFKEPITTSPSLLARLSRVEAYYKSQGE